MAHMMAKLNLLKHETLIRYPEKTCEDYFNLISIVPGAGLFLGVDGLSPAVVESNHSDHTGGCTLLADPPYRFTDTFRYPYINIHMWHCDWFYSIT